MKRLGFTVLLLLLTAFPSSARADVAPPHYPPGSNLQPGEEITQVRMVAETVTVEVLRDLEPGSLGQAHVTADFTMHNLGTADESMAARFPISNDDGFGRFPELRNLKIEIKGRQVQYWRTDYPDLYYPTLASVPWAEFNITFPTGQDVPIHVEYDLDGTGYYPYTVFFYVLTTGAGWKGTIGSADIILRLPYEANLQNIVMDETGWGTTTPGGVIQGREVHWHFDDFEPGPDQSVQNMEFALVAPSAWQNVLTAQDDVAKHPQDGEAWGRLGKAYKQTFQMNKGYREDAGGEELYQLSLRAYEQCLALEPEDAQWHAGFADLLATRVMWNYMTVGTAPETYRALAEIRTALKLAPNDPVVREIALNLTHIFDGGIVQNGDSFDFPWLTQTPTAWPTWTPTPAPAIETMPTTPAPTVEATATLAPQAIAALPTRADTLQATPTPAPRKSRSLCGSGALLPLFVLAWFFWRRK